MAHFAGLDWGGAAHAVCVIDGHGKVVARFEAAHTAEGLAELRRKLARFGAPAEVPVAIERHRRRRSVPEGAQARRRLRGGLLVDTLVDAGHPVVPIHPNAVKAARPRYRASGAPRSAPPIAASPTDRKSDSDGGDAYSGESSLSPLLADLLRTDGHRFAPLRPQSDEVRALRALVRGRDDLVATRVQLANQLRALLDGDWPGAAAIFADVDSPIAPRHRPSRAKQELRPTMPPCGTDRCAMAFIRRYPTPDSARRLGEKRLASFLAAHSYCGRRSPAELLARLRAVPAGLVGTEEQDACGEIAQALAATLDRLIARIATLTARVQHAVADLPEGRIVMSFPRAGQVCAAGIVAELGGVRERFPDPEALAMQAGVAPVTSGETPVSPKQSGKSRSVVFRWACNRRLRAAITCFADNSRHASAPWHRPSPMPPSGTDRFAMAAAVYARARQRGCDHPHAVRVLARAWVRVLWRAWQDSKPYDPTTHTAAKALAQPQGG